MAHLENEAKNEVKYSSQNKATADKIFSILKDSFGEKKTDTELLDLFFHRSQGKDETLMAYGHALQQLANRAIDLSTTVNQTGIE